MEEQKKEVKLNSKVNENKEKYSYEELAEICARLQKQNDFLIEQLKSTNMATMFKRLDYLFQVLGNASCFDKEFITKCTQEIENALTIPEETPEK